MTKTQLAILKLKRGQPVGFRTRSGLIKSLGHVNTLGSKIQIKLQGKKGKGK